MRRIAAFTLWAAAAVAAADKTPDQLVQQLGHEEYQSREAATKSLIAMGEKAVPALERALRSEDVEVRMRAGRALRAIRGRKSAPKNSKPRTADTQKADPRQPTQARPKTTGRPSLWIRLENGEYVVSITKRDADGKAETKTYRGKSLDEIKRKHPEVQEALGGRRFGAATARDPFKEFDKFFEEGWGRRRDDDFWQRADADLNQEIERLRGWARRLNEQQRRRQTLAPNTRTKGNADARLLGIRARRPEAVLDAQLQLRGRGLVIEEVARGSLATRLGLQRFDILLELNTMPVRGADDIGPALRGRAANDPVVAKVLRRGATLDLKSGDVEARAPKARSPK